MFYDLIMLSMRNKEDTFCKTFIIFHYSPIEKNKSNDIFGFFLKSYISICSNRKISWLFIWCTDSLDEMVVRMIEKTDNKQFDELIRICPDFDSERSTHLQQLFDRFEYKHSWDIFLGHNAVFPCTCWWLCRKYF